MKAIQHIKATTPRKAIKFTIILLVILILIGVSIIIDMGTLLYFMKAANKQCPE